VSLVGEASAVDSGAPASPAPPDRHDVSKPRHTARVAVVVFLLAVAVRVAAIGAGTGLRLSTSQLWGDAPQYQQLASNLAEGRGYSLTWVGQGADQGKLRATAFRPPLLPAVLAAVYLVTGPSPTAGRLALVLVDATTCALLVVLGTALASRAAGAVAGLLAAAYPPLWAHVVSLWSEPVFTLVIVVALILAVRQQRAPSARTAGLLGLALGLATLGRPNGFLLAVVLGGWAVWRALPVSRRRALAVGLACAGGAALVVVPWEVRNARALGAIVPVTTEGGPVLAGVYSSPVLDTSNPLWGWWDAKGMIDAVQRSSDEVAFDRRMRSRAVRWIVDHPGGDVELLGLRTVRYLDLYWSPRDRVMTRFPSQWSGVNAAAVLSWWAVLALGAVGLRSVWRSRGLGPWAPLLLTWAVLAACGVLIAASTRFRLPSDPIVLLLAAVGVVSLVGRRQGGGVPVAPETS
jgi:hypothetical protein